MLASSKTVELQYYYEAATTDGLGEASSSGEVEVYATLQLYRVS